MNDSVMIAFKLPPAVGQPLLDLVQAQGVPGSYLQPVDSLHMTLAYLGKAADAPGSDSENVAAALEKFAPGWSPIQGTLNGIGRFMDNPDQDCLYVNFDSPALPHFRDALLAHLKGADIDPVETHGFTPHLTLAYVPKDFPTPPLRLDGPLPVSFASFWEAYGDENVDIPLGEGGAVMPPEATENLEADEEKAMSTASGATGGFLDAEKDYQVIERDGKYYVQKKETGDLENKEGYDTKEEAEAFARAKYAHMPASEKTALSDRNDNPAAKAKDPATYGYVPDPESPSTWKLPMPDAHHVLLAAAAMGPNPPHGHGADIPSGDVGKVKAKIRSRARTLGLSDEDMKKVNAYLSGKMPSDVAEKDVPTWAAAFDRVFGMTRDETKAALAAQGAINRATILGVKSATGDLPVEVEGWAVLFTDPDNLDLQDTYFDDMTQLLLEYYPAAPLWYEHGRDQTYKSRVIGHRTGATVYPCGVWMKHALHEDDAMYPRTAREVADGLLAYSSDSIAHYAQRGYNPADGRLGNWPLAGCSLTKTPAEPGLGQVVSAKSFELALKSALSQREAAEAAPDAPTTDNPSIPSEDNMDHDQIEPGQNPETLEVPVAALDEALDSALNALAAMYGVNPPDALAVRKAMDSHIADIQKAGMADPALCKALGLDEKAAPQVVADHLNSMYTKATLPEVPATASYNYDALNRHLNSGAGAGKSAVPFHTGALTVAAKAATVSVTHNRKPPTMIEQCADILRIARGDRPKYTGDGAKAMSSATGPTGGYIVHQEIAPNVLDPLRAQTVCFQLGAEKIDMQGTSVLTTPIMNSAPAAYWVAENQAATDAQPGYRTVTLVPHGLQCLVKIPWNVEANMSPQADKQLRDQMAKSIALAIDYTALVGDGGAVVSGQGMTPVGLLNIPGVQTKTFASNGRVPTFPDVGDAFGLLDDANVPFDGSSRRGLALHSKIARALQNATDALGNPLLRPSWADANEKTMLAMPYGISNQIPTNITVGTRTDGSYVFLGDWQYMYIGLSDQVELRLDQTFAGNLQAGLLMYVYADIKVVYPQAFVVMKGVVPPSISGTTNSTNS